MTEVRVSPDRKMVAIKTGPGVTVGEWFVFHENNGGGYTDGVGEHVDDWAALEIPDAELTDKDN